MYVCVVLSPWITNKFILLTKEIILHYVYDAVSEVLVSINLVVLLLMEYLKWRRTIGEILMFFLRVIFKIKFVFLEINIVGVLLAVPDLQILAFLWWTINKLF